MAHREVLTMQYTEHVYYDDEGNEVARERQHDDHSYDSYTQSITDEELEEHS